ncbi:MAG: hypothetical protein KBT36_08940, partial [Kurthia sp.]|nr:hypothetical protein [Candidatus Kurthia equi]
YSCYSINITKGIIYSMSLEVETLGSWLDEPMKMPFCIRRKRKMKLSEVIALAKAGYSKKDIEVIKREEEKEVEKPIPPAEEPDVVVEDVPDPEDELIEVEEDEEEIIDYKKLFEESQAKLKEVQKENAKQPLPKVDNDIEIVNNFCRDFL